MSLFLLLSVVFSLTSQAQPSWDLNDVSYLFPLSSRSGNDLLKAKDLVPLSWFTETLADQGTMFTLDLTKQTGTADQVRSQSLATFNNIRLVAVRLDPCFKDLYSDACRPQLRAVWQPVDSNGVSVDASMHTFYDFTADEFKTVASQFQQLKAKYKISTTGLPLQVHPGFKQNGFAKDLNTLLAQSLKQDHLSRVAFMQLVATEFRWRFQSFDIKNQKLVPIMIPLKAATTQTFAIHRGSVSFGVLELSEEDLARSRNGEAIEKILLDYSLRIENPKINIPGTTDCLSCHAASGLKGISASALGMPTIPTVADVLGMNGKFNLKNTSKSLQDPLHFRAFGYVGREPSISDRVIIESAMVADSMNLIVNQR